jgi:hypothetical protein
MSFLQFIGNIFKEAKDVQRYVCVSKSHAVETVRLEIRTAQMVGQSMKDIVVDGCVLVKVWFPTESEAAQSTSVVVENSFRSVGSKFVESTVHIIGTFMAIYQMESHKTT